MKFKLQNAEKAREFKVDCFGIYEFNSWEEATSFAVNYNVWNVIVGYETEDGKIEARRVELFAD